MQIRTLYVLLMMGLSAGGMQLSCQHSPLSDGAARQATLQGASIADGKGPAPKSQESLGNDKENLLKAEQLFAAGKIEEAVPLLQQEVARFPQELQPRLLLGGALLELGKVEQAEKSLSMAVEKWPADPAGHLLLGYALLDRGERQRAVKEFQKVLELTEHTDLRISAHLGLASIQENLGNQKLADDHYGQALSSAPELRTILMNIQKALLWREPAAMSRTGDGTVVPVRTRRAQIEAELEKLHKEEGKK